MCGDDACKRSCADGEECADGFRCVDGSCDPPVPEPECIDESTLRLGPDDEQRCFPFRCADGACLKRCETDEECVLERACADGNCIEQTVSPADANDGSDCGCRVPGVRQSPNGSARRLTWLWVLALPSAGPGAAEGRFQLRSVQLR